MSPWPQNDDKEPVKYDDVLNISGEEAKKPIAPQDAAMMQAAETSVLGKTHKGGPAAVMQAAAARNERADVVGHVDVSDVAGKEGVTVTESDFPGAVVTQYVQPTPATQSVVLSMITIGEALEASAKSVGNKPVEQSDAAAIQAAEVRATGSNVITPGRLASTAQSAASYNATVDLDENKIKLKDILKDATKKLPADKEATRQDAEGVVSAELRNNPNLSTEPGGVAASVTAAARLNESVNM